MKRSKAVGSEDRLVFDGDQQFPDHEFSESPLDPNDGFVADISIDIGSASMSSQSPPNFHKDVQIEQHMCDLQTMTEMQLPSNMDCGTVDEANSVTHTTEAGGWSARTQKMYQLLQSQYDSHRDHATLSYQKLMGDNPTKNKKRIVAGCFSELLFLTTHNYITLKQAQPFGDILISKADAFNAGTTPPVVA